MRKQLERLIDSAKSSIDDAFDALIQEVNDLEIQISESEQNIKELETEDDE